MEKITKFEQMVGLTIKSAERNNQDDPPTLNLEFTNGQTVTIQGGGHDGYGDYIRIEGEES